MHVFLKKEQKKKSWEFVINKFIEQYPKQLYTLINQNYNWVNINTVKDYQLAKKLFKNYEK
jgi:GTP:adenosylcobinamide-phosphate guanylyltransferase